RGLTVLYVKAPGKRTGEVEATAYLGGVQPGEAVTALRAEVAPPRDVTALRELDGQAEVVGEAAGRRRRSEALGRDGPWAAGPAQEPQVPRLRPAAAPPPDGGRRGADPRGAGGPGGDRRRRRAGPVSAFEKLHPAIQYHVVNTLGWGGLRPVQ